MYVGVCVFVCVCVCVCVCACAWEKVNAWWSFFVNVYDVERR